MFKIIEKNQVKNVIGGKSSAIAASIAAIASRVASEDDGNSGKTVTKG